MKTKLVAVLVVALVVGLAGAAQAAPPGKVRSVDVEIHKQTPYSIYIRATWELGPGTPDEIEIVLKVNDVVRYVYFRPGEYGDGHKVYVELPMEPGTVVTFEARSWKDGRAQKQWKQDSVVVP